MALSSGLKLGPYEIHAPVGAGGMGEVYRARDTRLGRDVAIKVLPAGSTDPERLARFEQEARAAAALNHPNILAVFDIGTHDDAPYIVMELLEGETLRERLEAGPVPVRKAIDYAVQIAHGLAAAHEKGIIHRDVKPENVFVTSDERVKILDFGLAKLTQVDAALTSASMMVTGARHTSPGMLMGTVAYMSPEQVRGAAADPRSDIFALGAVLYEMITGRVAFQRETTAETVTAILRDDPPGLATLGKPSLEALIRRCLEKNPSARFQSALDLGFALESLATPSDSGSTVSSARPSRIRERIAWSIAALSLIVAAAATLTYRRAESTPATAMSFNVLPPLGFQIDSAGQTAQMLSVSPDGQSLAFVARDDQGKSQIWIRPLTSIEARPVAGTEGGRSVFWSPDGRWLGFFAEDKLEKVETAGGVATTLCDAPTGTSAAWGAGDVIVFSQVSPFAQGGTEPGAPGLWQVSAAGGAPAAITTVGPGERGHSRPFFLPDGRHFLFSAGNATPAPEASRTVYVAEIGRSDRTKLFTTDSLVVAYASGHLLFLRGTTLVAQPFDAERRVLSGEPIPIAEGIGVGATAGGNRFGVFSASADVLAFQTSADVAVHQLAWFDRSGRQLSLLGERASYQSIEILPGGLRAAIAVVDPTRRTRDIWTFDLARNVRTRFTFDPTEERSAIGSPDGRFIAFSSSRSGALEIYRKPASGGEDELLFKDGQSKDPMDWSSDGRYIVYRVTGQSSSNDIMALPLVGEAKPFPVVATQFDENYGRLSPDGRWLAYTSDESGQYEIYVTSFPSASGKWQISTNGGAFPRWRGDGLELYYLAPGNIMSAVSLSSRDSSITAEQPTALFKIDPPNEPGYAYAVTRDGQRFLVNTNLAPPNPLTVIVNWTSALQ